MARKLSKMILTAFVTPHGINRRSETMGHGFKKAAEQARKKQKMSNQERRKLQIVCSKPCTS